MSADRALCICCVKPSDARPVPVTVVGPCVLGLLDSARALFRDGFMRVY
jgi:hypothetical protein